MSNTIIGDVIPGVPDETAPHFSPFLTSDVVKPHSENDPLMHLLRQFQKLLSGLPEKFLVRVERELDWVVLWRIRREEYELDPLLHAHLVKFLATADAKKRVNNTHGPANIAIYFNAPVSV